MQMAKTKIKKNRQNFNFRPFGVILDIQFLKMKKNFASNNLYMEIPQSVSAPSFLNGYPCEWKGLYSGVILGKKCFLLGMSGLKCLDWQFSILPKYCLASVTLKTSG